MKTIKEQKKEREREREEGKRVKYDKQKMCVSK
jgi:hypothetical protein